MMPPRIGLLGAGGHAVAVASFLPAETELFWAVSREYLDPSADRHIDIGSPSDSYRDSHVIGAVGAPGLRRALVNAWPGSRFASLVSEAAYADKGCEFGVGTVVAPGAIVCVGVNAGDHSLVDVGAIVSHEARLGCFTTVCPGATIAGRAVIGDGAFIGAGATVANSVTIAPGVVVGAGAAVVGDVLTPNAIVVGVPARVVRVAEDWLDVL